MVTSSYVGPFFSKYLSCFDVFRLFLDLLCDVVSFLINGVVPVGRRFLVIPVLLVVDDGEGELKAPEPDERTVVEDCRRLAPVVQLKGRNHLRLALFVTLHVQLLEDFFEFFITRGRP